MAKGRLARACIERDTLSTEDICSNHRANYPAQNVALVPLFLQGAMQRNCHSIAPLSCCVQNYDLLHADGKPSSQFMSDSISRFFIGDEIN